MKTKSDNTQNPMYFTNEYGVNIYKYIEDGRTSLHRSEKEAKEKAKTINSYAYPVFVDGRTNGYWAVPK